MEKYQVKVVETLSRVVEQEADSYEDAKEIVATRYLDSEIVLDCEDLESVEYEEYPSPKIKDNFSIQLVYNKSKRELIVSDKIGTTSYSCKDYQELGFILKEHFDNNIELENVMPEIDVRKSKKDYER